jgi:predicted Fe-Mo cluster-binding NifX family protein
MDYISGMYRSSDAPGLWMHHTRTLEKKIMKIAIARDGPAVSGHFGHCEGFALYAIENCTATHIEDLTTSEGHGRVATLLRSKGICQVITGGIGQGAINILREQGIFVISGAQGLIDSVAQEFARGNLIQATPVCTHAGCSDDPSNQSAGSCTCSCHQKSE